MPPHQGYNWVQLLAHHRLATYKTHTNIHASMFEPSLCVVNPIWLLKGLFSGESAVLYNPGRTLGPLCCILSRTILCQVELQSAIDFFDFEYKNVFSSSESVSSLCRLRNLAAVGCGSSTVS